MDALTDNKNELTKDVQGNGRAAIDSFRQVNVSEKMGSLFCAVKYPRFVAQFKTVVSTVS